MQQRGSCPVQDIKRFSVGFWLSPARATVPGAARSRSPARANKGIFNFTTISQVSRSALPPAAGVFSGISSRSYII